MTYREWMAARQLLYEEHLGIHTRVAERERLAKENKLAEDYRRSAAELRRAQNEVME